MSIAAVNLAIRNHFYNEWKLTPYQLEDETFSIPELDADWVRLTINSGSQDATELNSENYSVSGQVIIQHFSNPKMGLMFRDKRIDQLCSIFRYKTIGGISFEGPLPTNQGISNGWQQFNIYIAFNKPINT